MLIFNGRFGKDKGIGDFTRDDTTGRSVVDYVLGTPKLLDIVTTFYIMDKVPESDHQAIFFSLKCKSRAVSKQPENTSQWGVYHRCCWTHEDLNNLNKVMLDPISESFCISFKSSIIDQSDPDTVARKLDQYISQACKRTFEQNKYMNERNRKCPVWYDAECRNKRSFAIKAGERVTNAFEKGQQDMACREYRTCKQRKERGYYRKCVNDIKIAYATDRTNLCKIINTIGKANGNGNEPEDCEFYHHFKDLSSPNPTEYFNPKYESIAIEFIKKYDAEQDTVQNYTSLIEEILNKNITEAEIRFAFDKLKTKKSAGIDGLPAEFLKECRETLTPHITIAINYIIECRCFPTDWSSGIRSAIHKQGKRNIVDNYRGITILPIMEKIFETVINNRLVFLNEAFDEIDRHNGGFLHGSRTSDVFLLNGLIERQMALGKPLLVCFIDFSKAFDIINRNILFYKLLNRGWRGRVIDALRSLYSKSNFCVKRNGKLSPLIVNNMGVNQGGIASGFLFRKYMADLGAYLSREYGIVIADEIIAHLLWADDLILFSDTQHGIQKQLQGLQRFCANNHMIVNETKTKIICFGRPIKCNVHFNGKIIEQVESYKYLGNVIRSVQRCDQDVIITIICAISPEKPYLVYAES